LDSILVFLVKFWGFVDIGVEFLKRYHIPILELGSDCSTHFCIGYFFKGNLYGLRTTSPIFLQRCELFWDFMTSYGGYMGMYVILAHMTLNGVLSLYLWVVWFQDHSFPKPRLVAARSPTFPKARSLYSTMREASGLFICCAWDTNLHPLFGQSFILALCSICLYLCPCVGCRPLSQATCGWLPYILPFAMKFRFICFKKIYL